MINIVIPMAGLGSRFVKAGFEIPKPLIPVLGKPMIQVVIENLRPVNEHKFIFICQSNHLERFQLKEILKQEAPNCEIVEINGITDGATCTVLKAKSLIDNANQLMIANCDQYIDYNINYYLKTMESNQLDGLIMTMKANDNKWSYVKLNKYGEIASVVEKEIVSEEATVGIYNYKHGIDFVVAAEKMISKNLRVNGEFYVAPVYNEMISIGKKIHYLNVGYVEKQIYGLGTPEDLMLFESKMAGRELCKVKFSNRNY
jgi:dTDP-glucose pyrophosphorylase